MARYDDDDVGEGPGPSDALAPLTPAEQRELEAFDLELHDGAINGPANSLGATDDLDLDLNLDDTDTALPAPDLSNAGHLRRSMFARGANTCGRKRSYPSASAARRAHAKAHWRVRPYKCARCHGWHVTNNEKDGVRGAAVRGGRGWKRRR